MRWAHSGPSSTHSTLNSRGGDRRRAFCQAVNKGIEGEEWEELHCHYREMNKATGSKKGIEKSQSESPLGTESCPGRE